MAQAAQKKSRDIEADWSQRATQSAIDAAKAIVLGKDINARATIGSLSDIEWGWIVAAAICEWIKTKAQQAVAEGMGYEEAIRSMPARNPEPWEAGAVGTILPALGDIKDLEWSKAIGDWSKDQIVSFAWSIYKLTDAALAARDQGAGDKIVQRLSRPQMERENSAAHGGPLMSRKELSDDIPF